MSTTSLRGFQRVMLMSCQSSEPGSSVLPADIEAGGGNGSGKLRESQDAGNASS